MYVVVHICMMHLHVYMYVHCVKFPASTHACMEMYAAFELFFVLHFVWQNIHPQAIDDGLIEVVGFWATSMVRLTLCTICM